MTFSAHGVFDPCPTTTTTINSALTGDRNISDTIPRRYGNQRGVNAPDQRLLPRGDGGSRLDCLCPVKITSFEM